jgi:hypothetical protein
MVFSLYVRPEIKNAQEQGRQLKRDPSMGCAARTPTITLSNTKSLRCFVVSIFPREFPGDYYSTVCRAAMKR